MTRSRDKAPTSGAPADASPSAGTSTAAGASTAVTVSADPAWTLIVYRVPTDSSRARVAIWRDLKRLGGLYLQQCVCIVPHTTETAQSMTAIQEHIEELGGTSNVFDVAMNDPQRDQLIADFRGLAGRDYAEIVEECQTKFVKEIEFERFRSNFTFEEVEEIRHDLEKIRRWFRRASARDWFGAPGRAEAETWIERCAALLDAFEEDVFTDTSGDDAPPPAAAAADAPAARRSAGADAQG